MARKRNLSLSTLFLFSQSLSLSLSLSRDESTSPPRALASFKLIFPLSPIPNNLTKKEQGKFHRTTERWARERWETVDGMILKSPKKNYPIVAKSRTISVRLVSMALTGYYRTMVRPRQHRPLSMMKYDPVGQLIILPLSLPSSHTHTHTHTHTLSLLCYSLLLILSPITLLLAPLDQSLF